MSCGATSTLVVHMAFDENPDPFGSFNSDTKLVLDSGFSVFIHDALTFSPLGLWHSSSHAEAKSVEPGSDNPLKPKLRALHPCPSHVI